MTRASPLDPKEHSIIHTFKASRCISFYNISDSLYRCGIMCIFIISFISLIISEVYENQSAKIIGEVCWGLNVMNISLHTLLICRSQMDRIYLIHLLGTPMFWLFFSIRNFRTEFGLWWIDGVILILVSIAFTVWSIPTRILYFKTFRLACVTLGTDSSKLLNMFTKYWILMVTSSFILSCIMFTINLMTKYKSGSTDALNSLFVAVTTIFEIFMYSRINPLAWPLLGPRKLGLKLGEKLYIVIASLMVLNGLVQLLVDFALGGNVPIVSRVVGYMVIDIGLTLRFVILWYYCVEELNFHEKYARKKNESIGSDKS